VGVYHFLFLKFFIMTLASGRVGGNPFERAPGCSDVVDQVSKTEAQGAVAVRQKVDGHVGDVRSQIGKNGLPPGFDVRDREKAVAEMAQTD
jgi:hypothetical protein